MKILQQGVLRTYTKKFSCTKCGCIFEADKGEYKGVSQMEYFDTRMSYKCNCPTCGEVVYIP